MQNVITFDTKCDKMLLYRSENLVAPPFSLTYDLMVVRSRINDRLKTYTVSPLDKIAHTHFFKLECILILPPHTTHTKRLGTERPKNMKLSVYPLNQNLNIIVLKREVS